MVHLRSAILALAFVLPSLPVSAQDLSALAPADEYFGHYRLSVLGIANTIRDSGARMDEGKTAAMIDGPLAFATDAIRAWERQFPRDPWIARDLFALQLVYLHAHTPRANELARSTEAWLVADYPDSREAADGRVALAEAFGDGGGTRSTADAWERFAALRAPLPPH
jgi:hypothetical protein